MKIRIALGASLGLAAAFAFVWLQFRAEAIAQNVSPKGPEIIQVVSPEEPAADSPEAFGSIQVFSDSDAESIPLPESIGNVAVSAEVVNEEPATSDPFADDTPPTRTSKPLLPGVESVDSDSQGYDPFSSAGAKLPSEPTGAFDAFASDSEYGGDDFGSSMKEQPIRILRLRTVRAVDVRSLFVNIFDEELGKPRWFLSAEVQSNSLIFKGPASYFDQLKKLASELDRLSETPIDRRKVTRSWPIPHAFDSSNGSPQWPIQILRLRHLKAAEFAEIVWDLTTSQNSQPQLRITFEHATNSVVLRGPAAEIRQVEQLAQQLDQPVAGPARRDPSDSLFDLLNDSEMQEDFDLNRDGPLENIEEPDVQTQRLRDYIAGADKESIRLASEIRSLRRQHSSNHPKLAEARQKLEDVLDASFQVRLQLQGLEVVAIKSRLADIESRVQRRSQLRQQIINRRLHELLGEKDDLSWEVARTSPALPSRSLDDLLPSPASPDEPLPGPSS